MNSQVVKYGLFILAFLVALATAGGLELPALGDEGQAGVAAVATLVGLVVKLWQNQQKGGA